MTDTPNNTNLIKLLTTKEYSDFSKKVLIPELNLIETQRLKIWNKYKLFQILQRVFKIGMALIIFSCFILAVLQKVSLTLPFVLFIFAFISTIILSIIESSHENRTREYSDSAKCTILKRLFSFFNMFTFYPKKEFASLYKELDKKIWSSKVFEAGYCDDYIKCHYKGMDIDICDSKKEEKKGEKWITTYAQYFSFKPPKNYKGSTILFGKIKSGDILMLDHIGYRKDHLEDPKFDKTFDFWTTDSIESRYVLTTSFMEKLYKLQIQKKFNISVSFEEEKTEIVFKSNKNWFEFPISQSAADPKICQQFIADLASVLSLIDELEFEKNIGL